MWRRHVDAYFDCMSADPSTRQKGTTADKAVAGLLTAGRRCRGSPPSLDAVGLALAVVGGGYLAIEAREQTRRTQRSISQFGASPG
jgi:hypothetical protein